MPFIHDDFLLKSETARKLYHAYAASEPIVDYHSHLPPADIARNRRFRDLSEIWLEGDHYKWRAMRASGIAERYCTGDVAPYEKFLAWARTVPFTLRNPLFHWTHLELKRYFGIDELLNEDSAKRIWECANRALQRDELSAHGIVKKFRVQVVCTSDDPCDSLTEHQLVNTSCPGFRVYPTFRPDRSLMVDQPHSFNQWVAQLEAASNIEIRTLVALLHALKQRHDFFHSVGSRLSDHGLPSCYVVPCTETEVAGIFEKVKRGQAATAKEHDQFASFLMLFFGRLDAEKGWTKQLHLGALRNVNTRRRHEPGPNTGFDTIGDWPQAVSLCRYMDLLEQEQALPRMIVYNVNPSDNYAIATAVGNFHDGAVAGKIQFGSAWWFLDQKEGIEAQINALSNTGLLSRFVGMVTDSRSFMSFPRHEYFRRVLCDLIGREVENGELPNDEQLLGRTVRSICFENAWQLLGLELPKPSEIASNTMAQK
jgi:glucuronate isomerase